MSDERPHQSHVDELPEAVVEHSRGMSIVWLIPLVAALIGGWLAYKHDCSRGLALLLCSAYRAYGHNRNSLGP